MTDFTVAYRLKNGEKHVGIIIDAKDHDDARLAVTEHFPDVTTVLCGVPKVTVELELEEAA